MAGLYENLLRVQKPSRYTNKEVGSIKKTYFNLRVCLVYPDLYEIGMSNLGFQIIYHLLNSLDGIYCERAFMPSPDAIEVIRKTNDFLCSIETRRPLSDFDVVAFSVSYELQWTNVLTILDLANIPIRSKDRDSLPIVIMGGYSAYTPASISPAFDVIVVGEGEEIAVDLFIKIRDMIIDEKSKVEIIETISKIDGVYIPTLHDKSKKIKARTVYDLDRIFVPDILTIPNFASIHDRLSVEVARGCRRGCRFCLAGFVQRPYRERSPERVIEIIENLLRKTGYDECSLLGLNTIDYSFITELVQYLTLSLKNRRIGVSLPSLRIDTPLIDVILNTQTVRPSQVTLAPEVASQTLANTINKDYDIDEFIKKVITLIESGIKSIKLYFMVGIPNENESDVMTIVELIKMILNQKRTMGGEIIVNLSAFVPKAHTPLQWAPFTDIDILKERIKTIRKGLRTNNVKVKYQNVEMSLLEAILGRGDDNLFDIIVNVYRKGAILDGWTDYFRWDIWKTSIEDCGFSIDTLIKEIGLDRNLPWENIDTGVSREYLLSEYKKFKNGKLTPQCEPDCKSCGVCSERPIKLANDIESLEMKENERRGKKPSFKTDLLRFTFSKTKGAIYISHLDLQRAFHLALRRAGVPVAFTEGFNPLPRLSLGYALALGIVGHCEVGEVRLSEAISAIEFMDAMNEQLPEGIIITGARNLGEGAPEPAEFNIQEYRITIKGNHIDEDKKKTIEIAFKNKSVEVKRKGKIRVVDLGEQIHRWWIDDCSLIIQIRVPDSGAMIRLDELKELIFSDIEKTEMKIERAGIFILLGDKILSPFDEKTLGY
ncbi:MAG: TIGR03960 family B12-binding radical SAM protein [bacterium]